MSRKTILPGAGIWDVFYDKDIQDVLERRFIAPASLAKSIPKIARQEALAWPITVCFITDSFSQDSRWKMERQTDFLHAYAEDRQFVADLLCALTRYHQIPVSERTLTRRIVEASKQIKVTGRVETVPGKLALPTGRLFDWKEFPWPKSPSHLMKEFSVEKSRRNRLEEKWRKHMRAYDELLKLSSQSKRPIVPLEYLRFIQEPYGAPYFSVRPKL